MKKSIIFPASLSVSSLILTFPLAALAITEDVFQIASYIINASIYALIGVATIVFMYGVILYVIAGGDEKKLASGKTYMLYGIVGLTVMVAMWGFVNLLIYTIFGSATDLSSPNAYPSISGGTGGSSSRCITIFGIGQYCY